jgi:hypothetical protein
MQLISTFFWFKGHLSILYFGIAYGFVRRVLAILYSYFFHIYFQKVINT